MVEAAPLELVENLFHHCSSPAKKLCALAKTVELALNAKKNGIWLAVKKKIVSYKQFGLVKSTFQG